MSSPIPEHENSRFWLFRDKFVIVEAVLRGYTSFSLSKNRFFLHISIVYCSKNNFLVLYGRIINSRITVSMKNLIL